MEGMDAMQQLRLTARRAMLGRDYHYAVELLSKGLSHQYCPPQYAALLLLDRADYFWQLGNVHRSLQDMDNSLRIGLPSDDYFAEEESLKWSDHGRFLLQGNEFLLAERCANFSLYFRTSPGARVQASVCKAFAQYELGKESAARTEIQEVKKLDPNLAKSLAQERKDIAIQNLRNRQYERSKKDFNLALLLHPDDGFKMSFKRSVESHLANAYFKLEQFVEAVELGEEIYRSNSHYKSREEAKRWKERGNQLSKQVDFVDLAISCYSLALKFTPGYEKDLRAFILSNRSLMYKNQGNAELALKDAQECVDAKPHWAKAQYRLGSSYLAQKKYSEAMKPFSRSLQLLLSDASSSEHDKIDTFAQLLSIALKLPDGTSGIQYDIPKTVIQTSIDKAVADKDWHTLHLLFLGGGGQKQLKKGLGGLAVGCDASSVPLQEIIRCDFSDLKTFISILLGRGATDNPQKGEKSALDVACEFEKFDVANVLPDRSLKSGAGFSATSSRHVQLKNAWKTKGLEALRGGENSKAIELLLLSLKHDDNTTEDQNETFQHLCKLYFQAKAFGDCLHTGRKLKETCKGQKDEVKATQWKNWGNELHKERKYELMAEYYTLALEFTPASKKELLATLLSNRCLALIKLEQLDRALSDAEKCVKIRPKWFRGHSRHGTCLLHLKRKEEALQALCRAYEYAVSDKDKQATALDVISTSMNLKGGESQITCTLSPQTLQFLVEAASEKREWKKIRYLYLGSTKSTTSRGLAFECDASCVPLDLLIGSDLTDLHQLLKILLQRGASPDGLRGCDRPPLLAAMEMMKFPLAVTLLRNNADPACVVGHNIFINREGQPKQWLELGRRALDAKDNKKAVMLLNMSRYLSESSTDQTINPQVYHALAEAYFNVNEHERCIDAGKECFKLRPMKSEEEANRWKERADRTFNSRNVKVSIEYVNLALKYTPAESKKTFSLLLCRRSEAFQQLGDFKSGVEDAKNASKMCPEDFEVHRNQLKCFRALKNEKEAMHATNECLKRTTDVNLIYDLLCDAVEISANLQEGTSAITVPVPSKLLYKLVSHLIKKKDWAKLRILYLGGGGPALHATGNGGLATGVDASTVPIGEIICSNVRERLPLVSALIKHGASANAIDGSDAIPLEEAMRLRDARLVEKLIQNGANPCVMSKDGEPIIHQALRKGLQKNGTFHFLREMLKSKIPEVQNVKDSNGDSLYHIACTGKSLKKYKCDAIRILQEANVNPNLLNKRNEYAIGKVQSKRDPRWKMLTTALETYKSSSSASVPHEGSPDNVSNRPRDQEFSWPGTKNEDASCGSDIRMTSEVNSTPAQNIKASRIEDKQQLRMQRRENVALLIDAFTPLPAFIRLDTNEEQDDIEMSAEPSGTPCPMESENDNDMMLKDETDVRLTRDDDRDFDADVVEEEGYMEGEIDSKSPFEDLPWEVDCTDRVWKVMRSKKVDNSTRRRVIDKIRMLANGRWSKTLCKRLEGEAKKKDIHLYESKLTKGQRIIWEKTIAFSGRCSENPELRLDKKTSEGRIYSDIIRVWDIVLDHDKLQRSIEHIVKSHDKGMDCIIKRKLKGIPVESRGDGVSSIVCLPNQYAEVADLEQMKNPLGKRDVPKKTVVSNELSQIFFPPASSNEKEYHILKFYSFSTALVKTVLESDTSSKIDFPFKITELEHAIVNLRPDPPIPIILLGRSGTGKTTCCLYRLWDNFQRYWERAQTAGSHIPRYLPPVETSRCSDEDETPQSKVHQCENQAESSQQRASLASDSRQVDVSLDFDSALKDYDHAQMDIGPHSSLQIEQNQLEENDTDDMKQPVVYEHLHQIFITKNTVLCSEVEKNFKELCHACPAAEHRLPFENQTLPAKIQNVSDEAWPLFVNSRDWILMLDASLPGKTFFKRAEDGSLLRKIDGWAEEDTHLQVIPTTESDEESDNEDDDEVAEPEQVSKELKQRRKQTTQEERDPRREITYHVFHAEVWPKMKKFSKEKIDYHPTLVWTEIRSFIKGSAEALLSKNGVLSLKDYESLGKKKAPNFSADRKVVYDLFRVYERERSSKGMFDEADVVFNIHQRLQSIATPEWSVHQFYVDETQDFTQAELSILIRCCRYPNELFFTGDTAQSIMRGISFRFSDLMSLFYHAKKAAGIKEDQHDLIRVPNKLYQLTHNYRSHGGILRLASSVVDLLLRYFPESFDRLQKDKGLFDGPKPVLLECCSPTDLAMILQGNQRQSSRIEFGAHQVVLVVSNEAREVMPDELKQGLVMTIYEAKGLEFDDVLIYNFFKDSQATKEWRVVTSFMKDKRFAGVSSSTGLVLVTEDSVATERSRPLEFDPEKHKVLNSEFKYLYTAITRARVNVWFFDEDKESRAPMFEYFQKLGLVKVVSIRDQDAASGELVSMFAAKSTPDEWRKGGLRFYKHRLWRAAIQCFTFAGDEDWIQKSQAQQQAAEATKFRSTNRQIMKDEFLRAGESFLKCYMYDEAAICLNNAREWVLLAKLYEKIRKFQDAARLFKKEGLYKEASRCYESQNNYAEAIEVFCRAGLFEEALSALERYNILASSGDIEGRQGIIPPRPTRTVERLRHQLADQYFKRGEIKQMENVLQYLPSTTDRITFLKKRGCILEAARALNDDGRRNEAARLLKDAGKFEEAERYSSDPKFAADCLISLVRTTTETEDTPAILQRAFDNYQFCKDVNGQAEALLMLGRVSNDFQKLQEAGRLFFKSKNSCGEVESVMELLETTNCAPPKTYRPWMAVQALERVLRLINSLQMPAGKLMTAQQIEITKCEEHFGLFKTEVPHKKRYFLKCGGRFSKVYPEFIKNNTSNTEATIDTTEAHQKIGRFLIKACANLVEMIRGMLEKIWSRNSLCKKIANGTMCNNPDCEYPDKDSVELFDHRFHALFHFIHLEAVVESFNSEMTSKKAKREIVPLNYKEFREFRTCQRFYDFFIPLCGYRECYLTSAQVRRLNMKKAVTKRIFHFAEVLWKNKSEELRRSDTDNFLKVSSCLQLIGSAPTMVRWIGEEEKEFGKKARNPMFRATKVLLAKHGMVFSAQSGGYESYLRWWEDGKKRLYVDGNVENAAHLIIRRFLTLTAKRSEMIYPSIANTVMILEHQLTACLALYSRLKTDHLYPACILPASYLAMVRFWDDFRPRADKGTLTLYEAVENTYTQEANKMRLFKAVSSLLEHMARLTCGDVAPLFDVLGDALDSENTQSYCESGEAERTLVVFLTMMCNCGKGIPTHLEKLMLRKVLSVKSNPRLTSRINTALDEIHEMQGPCDVVAILKKFLKSRGEKLYDLRWNKGRLWYDHDGASNPTSYPKTFNVDLSSIREELKQDQHQEEASEDKGNTAEVDAVEEGMEVEHTEAELKERENTRREANATMIKKWYRRMKLVEKIKLLVRDLKAKNLQRLQSTEEQMILESDVLLKHFLQFRVDKSACGICRKSFKSSTDETLPMINEDNEAEGQELSETTEETSPETAEAHRYSPAHIQKEKEFHRYEDLYLSKVYPCLAREAELRKMLENPSLSGKKTHVALDLERLERILSKIQGEVQNIESSLSWENISSLQDAVKEFEKALQETERIVEQASLTAENDDGEPEEKGETLYELENKQEEEDNSTLKEMPHENKRGGRSKRRRKSRKK